MLRSVSQLGAGWGRAVREPPLREGKGWVPPLRGQNSGWGMGMGPRMREDNGWE